jgi:hypothetical protein
MMVDVVKKNEMDGVSDMTTIPDDDEVIAFPMVEEVSGIVECYSCDYFGRMTGYIMPDNRKQINFKCPECEALEVVQNPEVR